jgi:hypothetical protein
MRVGVFHTVTTASAAAATGPSDDAIRAARHPHPESTAPVSASDAAYPMEVAARNAPVARPRVAGGKRSARRMRPGV